MVPRAVVAFVAVATIALLLVHRSFAGATLAATVTTAPEPPHFVEEPGGGLEAELPVALPTPATACGSSNATAAAPPRIVYSVLTGDKMHETRVAQVQRTWARHIDRSSSLVFFSDHDDLAVPTVRLSPPGGEELHTTGAWRNLPALRHLHDHRERFGCFEWVFFVDDDAYVFPRNLERRLAARTASWGVGPSQAEYLGVYHTPRVDLEWRDARAHIAYAHGGAGYLLSWPMLQKLRPGIDKCHEAYTGWAGDLRVGKCISIATGSSQAVEHFRGLHPEPPEHYVWEDAATVERLQKRGMKYHTSAERWAPISFHHLSAEGGAALDRMHLVVDADDQGRVWEYDFSAAAFGEHRFADPAPSGERREHRLLFGFRIEVQTPEAPSLRAQSRHSGWRTLYDNLLAFRRVDATQFVMELGVTPSADTRESARVKPVYPFPRDTCPDHPRGEARLKRAIVRIRCGAPCARTARAGVCAAWYQRSLCDMLLDFALPACPQARLRTFRRLSVGTAVGDSDVVRDGAPVGAWKVGATALRARRGSWVALAVHSELPVWIGRPQVRIEPPSAHASAMLTAELSGSLVGLANRTLVAPGSSASLFVRARCHTSGAVPARFVLHVHAPVERGEYEAMRFALAHSCR